MSTPALNSRNNEPDSIFEIGERMLKKAPKETAMFVSSVALLIIPAIGFVFFAVVGGILQHFLFQAEEIGRKPPKPSIYHVVLACVGLVAEILKYTPIAAAGGLAFQFITPIASMAVGSYGYRVGKWGFH